MAFRILIVEDEVYERERVRAVVSNLGCEIAGIANDSITAVQLAEQTRPGLALVHMDLGSHDEGFRITRELRINHHLPVILLGPSSSDDLIQRACAAGCIAYLVEPLRSHELDAVIRIALRQDSTTFQAFEKHSWLTAMFDSLSDGVIATDVDGIVQFLNPAAQLLTNWIPLDAIGKPIDDIYPLSDIKTTEKVRRSQIHKVLASQLPTGKQRFLLAKRTGERITVEDSATPILDGTAFVGAVTIFANIAGRIADEKAASDRQDLLRDEVTASNLALGRSKDEIDSLVGRLIDSQEDERRRLARELHDDLSQRAALALQLVDRFANTSDHLPAGSKSDLELLKSMISELSTGIREVSHRLHPAIIEDLGLPHALRSLARDYREIGLDLADIVSDELAVIPLPTATTLYRIAQEALQNTTRHAPGAPARLSLKSSDDHIELRIEDAGPGFSLVHAKQKHGLGLLSMQERVRSIGGSVLLKTGPGEGTVVLVTVPLETHAAQTTDSARRRSSSDV